MARLILLISLFSAAASSVYAQTSEHYSRADSLRGGQRKERSCYDLQSYDLSLNIDTLNKAISGKNIFSFIAIEDFHTLQIDLFENMEISRIESDQQALSFRREYNAVFIHFPQQIKKGTPGSFTVFFSGKPHIARNPPWDGGFSWTHDDEGKTWIAVSCQGIGASLWWPCKEDLSDEPVSMQIHCNVPSSLRCVANGKEDPPQVLSNGTTTYNWRVSYPINNYNVSVNIGDYYHLHDHYEALDGDTLALDYYVLSYNVQKAKRHFTQVKPMMACYEKYLGKYPFWDDGYALVETPYLGMEHQSAIAYGNRYKTGYSGMDRSGIQLSFDYIIVHETGHEWWGNSVSAKDLADMWIHESFCTYSEAIYVECMYNYDTAMVYVNALRNTVSNSSPMIGAYGVNQEGHSDMYLKGMLFLNTLRHVINDDHQWWSMIKTMSDTTFKFRNVDYSDVVRFFNEKSGKNLSPIFEQYVKYASLPAFEYSLTKRGNSYKLRYRWKADVSGFNMPLDVFILKKKLRLFPNQKWKTKKIVLSTPDDFMVDRTHFYIAEKKIKAH
ncbi:MAG: M1 family metallopeptidase [Crocinitomicaceae bacterium]|nr:M1 family metallopeptidase [Crocinitomicaceae bacterium]